MGVLVIVELTAQEGKGDELASMFREVVPDTRSFEGCEWCNVYRDQDTPSRFTIVETFASREHYDRYFAWRGERGDLDQLGALLAGPPELRFLDDTGA